MKLIILLLAILAAGGAVVWVVDRLFYNRKAVENADETDETGAPDAASQGCADEGCGLRSICPSEQMLAGACKEETVYYDDEELDAFAGRAGNGYTPEEEEQWRDVLYTLQPADLLGWGQSVKHRGLEMPDAIRAEFLQLASEQRAGSGMQ